MSDDDWSPVKMFDLPEESTLPVNLNLIYQEQAKYPLIQEMTDQLEKSLTILKQNKKLSKLQQFTILEMELNKLSYLCNLKTMLDDLVPYKFDTS